jgi:hypothetical protein
MPFTIASAIARLKRTLLRRRPSATQVPADLVAHHVASIFVLVLNWWVESASELPPADVDAKFPSSILPTLAAL